MTLIDFILFFSSNGSTSVGGGGGNGSAGGGEGVGGDSGAHIDEEEWDNIDPLVDNGEPGVKVRALYDYEAAEEDELDFKAGKVENILKYSLDSIPSPSPSVKIQIMGGKVCLRCKGKTWLDVVKNILKTKSLLTSPSNVLPYYLK